MTFQDFDLNQDCLDILTKQGIIEPTPIQEAAIPVGLGGADLVGTAQTGTGKTLAFTLPSLTLMSQRKAKPGEMLILVPTRELCTQVHRVIKDLTKPLHLHSVSIYGGVGYEPQIQALQDGAQIIVATPGRLLDLMERGNAKFKSLKILVLDEADRMLDMGFLPDIQCILAELPEERQTLMFSATFPPEIERLAQGMMTDPERVSVGPSSQPVDAIRQELYPVRPQQKNSTLLKVLDEEDPAACLIFCRTKFRTERLSELLSRKKYKIATIHGDRTQAQRQQALDGFRKGKNKILVATDVASRGLDIEGVSHVINFDIPLSPDDYIHRVGRTARAKSEGDAVTFVTPDEFQALGAIEKALGKNIPRKVIENAPTVISTFKVKTPGAKKRGSRGARRVKRGASRRR